MKKLQRRASFALVLAGALLLGLAFYIFRYFRDGKNWALSPVSADYYSGGVLRAGTLTDRNGLVLAHAADGHVLLHGGKVSAAKQFLEGSAVHDRFRETGLKFLGAGGDQTLDPDAQPVSPSKVNQHTDILCLMRILCSEHLDDVRPEII